MDKNAELSVNALEQSTLAERVISNLDASEEVNFESITVDENHSTISRLKLPLNTNTKYRMIQFSLDLRYIINIFTNARRKKPDL